MATPVGTYVPPPARPGPVAEWDRPYTRAQWLDQVPTFGGHSEFPPDRLDELLAGIAAAVDTVGGSFTMRYATVAVTAVRTGGAAQPGALRP